MRQQIILIVLIFFYTFSSSLADDFNFVSTKDEIIDALTKPKARPKTKTRSLNGVNFTKNRGLKIVTEKNGELVSETIDSHEKSNKPCVNLKINFDFDSYKIRSDSFGLINELGKALSDERLEHKDIIINGHTDATGADSYNLKLSYQRGRAVKKYLTENFPISSFRIEVFCYGESLPLVPNSNKKNRKINRRVEIMAK